MNAEAAEPVFVGLGSNMADPAKQVMMALERLDAKSEIGLQHYSSLYRSPPWGDPDQADFVNAVAQISTLLAPVELLDVITHIERDMGRKRNGHRWGPRIMDLDLLAFGGRIINTDRLTVPHPRIAERAFVLVPFAEIAPQFSLPGLGPIDQLLTLRDDAGSIRRLKGTRAGPRQEHV